MSQPTAFPDLRVALQPIVNVHTGQCFGHEALLRGWRGSGGLAPEDLLAAAHQAGILLDLEIAVREYLADRAGAIPVVAQGALFINLDARVGDGIDRVLDVGRRLLAPCFAHVVTEISALSGDGALDRFSGRAMRRMGGMLAVDRFGAAAHSLELLTLCDPDYLKIDLSLVQGVESDARKRVVLAQMVSLAHTLGIEVVAMGIETLPQLNLCRELGIDLIQGNVVMEPQEDYARLMASYSQVDVVLKEDRRSRQIDQRWIVAQMDTIQPILVDCTMKEMFERFASAPHASLLPVVDGAGRPLGIIRDRDMKNFAYSPFGKDLISNKALGRRLRDYVVRCPIADLATPLDQMLAIFSAVEEADGIMVSERMVYRGFLTARSLIRAMHEKTLARARDENPLTKLPGNAVINEYITQHIGAAEATVLAYIDFDNFKPFNDTYGFRQGDRAILLFADLCRKAADPQTWFIGHIGGDDFFLGLSGVSMDESRKLVGDLIAAFASDAESFYDSEARARGCISAQDREGVVKCFPLLSASAVLLEMPAGVSEIAVDDISSAIAAKKKAAKSSPDKLALAAL
jgi:diguanylate cyclase (GGDEF)-like protein